MPHAIHPHYSNHISDLVNDAVISDTNSSVALRSSEFAAAGRPRVFGETSESSCHARQNPGGQALQVFLGRPLDKDLIHPSTLREIGEYILQRTVVELLSARLF